MEELWSDAGRFFVGTVVFFIASLYWRRKMDEGYEDADFWYRFVSLSGLAYAFVFFLISLTLRG